ncbi:MAG TPA: GNAT family N-acetyltransferase [Actinomycetota bacterium]|nr:GNAT family N-acetyltransferase [Actinomycetota bacterium]
MSALRDAQRARSFLRSFAERLSTRVEPFAWGTAFLDARHPIRYDSNFLWTGPSLDGCDAETLAMEADRILGGAGFGHREILIERGGERLAAGLGALGYERDECEVMVLRREPDRPRSLSGVVEVDADELIPAAREVYLRMPGTDPPDVAGALAEHKRTLAEVGSRFFAIRVGDRIASMCDLYVQDRVAQIEDVQTLEEYRGRGMASAIVLRAAAEARASGCDLVFLVADARDWPRLLYARLGFEPIDGFDVFVRRPDR